MHRFTLPILAITALGWSGPASAHAFLKSAMPAVGATLPAAPTQVTIEYTEAVEPKFSAIQVEDAAGGHMEAGAAQSAPGDARHLTVALRPLRPGAYKVTWHVTAQDTHKSEGSYSFTVSP